MNDHRPRTGEGRGSPAGEEERVHELLDLAGPRPEVPPAHLAAIKAAFRDEWKVQVEARRRRRARGALLALAASLLLALGLGLWLAPGEDAASPIVARAEFLTGTVTAWRDPGTGGDPPRALAAGQSLAAGTVVETAPPAPAAPGRVALRLGGGPSVRLDRGSRVRLISASVLELEAGAVYVDSRPDAPGSHAPGAAAVEIRTSLGVVRDIGTQFEVRLLAGGDEAVRVRVREGLVRIEGEGGASYSAHRGAGLTLHDDGSVDREEIASHGPGWEWILAAAPAFDLEGRTLGEFLDWVARETGWEIRFEDPGLAAEAGTILLHGHLGGLAADQAPEVVLPGADLGYRLGEGVLLVLRTPS